MYESLEPVLIKLVLAVLAALSSWLLTKAAGVAHRYGVVLDHRKITVLIDQALTQGVNLGFRKLRSAALNGATSIEINTLKINAALDTQGRVDAALLGVKIPSELQHLVASEYIKDTISEKVYAAKHLGK